MARLPRLVLPGLAHYIIQRSQGGQSVLAHEADRELLLALIARATAAHQVRLHAFALLDQEVQLLCTPPDVRALSRLMQDIGRRYVSAYNLRHGRSGPLWDGRFRCAVVEPGVAMLDVLCLIDGHDATATEAPRTTAGQRMGGPAVAAVGDPPEYWALGNTPFEREAAYRRCLADGLAPDRAAALAAAVHKGWAVGDAAFLAALAQQTDRPVQPRPRGRPPRAA